MMNKIKSIFFPGVFFILYVAFAVQLVYAIYMLAVRDMFGLLAMGALSVQWLCLITARFLSKRSASGNPNREPGGHPHHRHRR